jgi:hypothetical protein
MSVIALMSVMMSLGSAMVLIICGICEGLAVFMYVYDGFLMSMIALVTVYMDVPGVCDALDDWYDVNHV